MVQYTNNAVPAFDFADALQLSVDERFQTSVRRIRDRFDRQESWDLFGLPPIPETSATDNEIEQLEKSVGTLPKEYRQFLRSWRYLKIDDGFEIWGFDHEGASFGSPWLSDEHLRGSRHLVFGHYWVISDNYFLR